jgi:hypothetical protein
MICPLLNVFLIYLVDFYSVGLLSSLPPMPQEIEKNLKNFNMAFIAPHSYPLGDQTMPGQSS